MTTSTPRITVTENYVDITVAQPSLSGADVFIQNLDDDTVDVVFATTPDGMGPVRLDTLDSVEGNKANIWVRGSGTISATLKT